MIKPRIGLIFRRRTLLFSDRCRSSSPLITCRYHIRIMMSPSAIETMIKNSLNLLLNCPGSYPSSRSCIFCIQKNLKTVEKAEHQGAEEPQQGGLWDKDLGDRGEDVSAEEETIEENDHQAFQHRADAGEGCDK